MCGNYNGDVPDWMIDPAHHIHSDPLLCTHPGTRNKPNLTYPLFLSNFNVKWFLLHVLHRVFLAGRFVCTSIHTEYIRISPVCLFVCLLATVCFKVESNLSQRSFTPFSYCFVRRVKKTRSWTQQGFFQTAPALFNFLTDHPPLPRLVLYGELRTILRIHT